MSRIAARHDEEGMNLRRRSVLVWPLACLVLPRIVSAGSVRIVVKKAERRLELYTGDTLTRRFPIALGSAPRGAKRRRGDGATPEGDYYVTHHNAKSQYHLSLGLSYPNAADAARGLASGLLTRDEHRAIVEAIGKGERPPQDTRLGGDVFLHGGGTLIDWTRGCVAVSNDDMDVLFASVPKHTPVRIVP